MAQQKEQWFYITAATLFLIGAVFMLFNTFGGQEWALWVGIGFAVAAAILFAVVQFARMRFNKKYTVSEKELPKK